MTKKIISMMLGLILVLSTVVCAHAADMKASLEPSSAAAAPGQTFTVTVSVSCDEKIASGAVSVAVSDQFTVRDGEWIVDGIQISDYNTEKNQGVFLLNEARALNGAVLVLTLEAGQDAAGNGDIDVTVIGKNGSDTVGTVSASTTVAVEAGQSQDSGKTAPEDENPVDKPETDAESADTANADAVDAAEADTASATAAASDKAEKSAKAGNSAIVTAGIAAAIVAAAGIAFWVVRKKKHS